VRFFVLTSCVCTTKSTSFCTFYEKMHYSVHCILELMCPENARYIVPAQVSTRLKGNIRLAPHKKGEKY